MKIWNSKNQKINQKVDTFLSGEDIHLDNEIFIFDVDASIAHTGIACNKTNYKK